MKICVISTTVIKCPPDGYAGLEMISWQCANGLHKKGHEVTLIAPKESTTETRVARNYFGRKRKICLSWLC